jgi:hypothetical protein
LRLEADARVLLNVAPSDLELYGGWGLSGHVQ